MRPRPSGVVAVAAAAALALIAAGAASLFVYGIELVTAPVDSETTYVHTEIVLPALAGTAGECRGRCWQALAESRSDPRSSW